MTSKLKQYLLGVVVVGVLVVVAGNLLVRPSSAASTPKNLEYAVMRIDKRALGTKGATQYQNLLNNMASKGWRLDHTLPGLAIFRR